MVEIEKGGKYAWFVLTILAGIYVQNQWSRYSLNYMYAVAPADDDHTANFESIKYSTNLNAADYGILTGYGFSGTFCIAGLVAGRLADVGTRKYIIFAGVVIWNIGMFGIGMSKVFWQLLMFRLVLGAGQAFTNPASYALIADYFPEEKRAEANGLFACGVYLGGGVASLSIEMAESWGWRRSCYFIALVGFALAATDLVAVREPPRAGKAVAAGPAADAPAAPTLMDSLREIFGNRCICVLFAASSFRFMGGYAIATYLPTFYSTVYSQYSTQYSYINCYVVAAGGFLSSWGGGIVADRWLKVEPKARLYLPALGCFLGIPFFCVCCLVPNFYVSILLGLFCEYLVAECWFGPIIAVVQSQLSPTSRAQAISWFTLIANFWSSAFVAVLGVVYDKLLAAGHSAEIVRWIVLCAVVGCYCIAGLLFIAASRFIAPPETEAAREPLLKSSGQQDPEKANAVGAPPMLTGSKA